MATSTGIGGGGGGARGATTVTTKIVPAQTLPSTTPKEVPIPKTTSTSGVSASVKLTSGQQQAIQRYQSGATLSDVDKFNLSRLPAQATTSDSGGGGASVITGDVGGTYLTEKGTVSTALPEKYTVAIPIPKPTQVYSSSYQEFPTIGGAGTEIQRQQVFQMAQGRLGTEQKGTQITSPPTISTGTIYLTPTIYREPTGTFTDVSTGKQIRTFGQAQYTEGIIGTKIGAIETRAATPTEAAMLDTKEVALVKGEVPSVLQRRLGEVKESIGQSIYEISQGDIATGKIFKDIAKEGGRVFGEVAEKVVPEQGITYASRTSVFDIGIGKYILPQETKIVTKTKEEVVSEAKQIGYVSTAAAEIGVAASLGYLLGGTAAAKWFGAATLAPFLKEPIEDLRANKNPFIGALAEFVPTTPFGVGEWYTIGKFTKVLPLISSIAFEGLGTYQFIKSETPKEKIQSGITIGLSSLGLTKLMEYSIFGEKPQRFIPTKELERYVEPFSRKRATVMLKTKQGDYILGKTKSGEIISIGGGIEKGQTPRSAALAELQQETGLLLKDISNFKSAGKVITPEETFYLFTGNVKDISKIKPASDILDIINISPKNLFIKGATGQTALQPISRYVPFKGRVRAYEAGIINFLEGGEKPTWLSIETPIGQYILGTQSRYNVPFTSQKKYFNEEELFLAHGTSKPAILKKFNFEKEKTFTIEGKFTQRGQAQGLYLQPPISSRKGKQGYIGLSYLGFQTSQESLGIKIAFPKRTAFLFKEKLGRTIQPTPKTYSGIESEVIIIPKTKISTLGEYRTASIGLKRVRLQPTTILDIGKKGGKNIDISIESNYKTISPFEFISTSLSPTNLNVKYENRLESLSKKSEISKKESTNLFGKSYVVPSYLFRQSKIFRNIPSRNISLEEQPKNLFERASNLESSRSLIKSLIKESTILSKINKPYNRPRESSTSITTKIERPSLNNSYSNLRYLGNKNYRTPSKNQIAYSVLIKRRGKFIPIATNLPRGRALQFGSIQVQRELSRQFKLVKAGTTTLTDIEFRPRENIYRGYKVRKGRQIPLVDQFIQRTSANLKSDIEKQLLIEARMGRRNAFF